MAKNKLVEKIVDKVGDLPAIPEIVAEVMVLTDNPDTGLSTVSEVIERDPALTAKLLKISNSPYYGMRQVVGTLKLALVILGIREVRNIVLGVSVLDALKNERVESILGKLGFWEHSFATGALSKRLSEHFSLGMQGEDFVAGLLHDMGKLLLWRKLEREYEAIHKESEQFGRPLHLVEQEALGFDHADVGLILAGHWNLPASLCDAIGYHHADNAGVGKAENAKLAAVVRLANEALHDDWGADESAHIASCADDFSWALLTTSEQHPDLDQRRTILSEFMAELGEATPVELF